MDRKDLEKKMRFLGIKESDIQESFIRASRPGGQNVNKTSSCVYIKHLPSGIEVKCQEERYQGQNRIRARLILVEKIESLRLKEKRYQTWLKEKLLRQERKRSKSLKERILEKKHRQADKKKLRQKVMLIGEE